MQRALMATVPEQLDAGKGSSCCSFTPPVYRRDHGQDWVRTSASQIREILPIAPVPPQITGQVLVRTPTARTSGFQGDLPPRSGGLDLGVVRGASRCHASHAVA